MSILLKCIFPTLPRSLKGSYYPLKHAVLTFDRRPMKLVPIMVGSTNPEKEAYYGKLLAKYFDDDNTVFVISSDFCHWGKRYYIALYEQNNLLIPPNADSVTSIIKKKTEIFMKVSRSWINAVSR